MKNSESSVTLVHNRTWSVANTWLRPEQNGHYFADNIFQRIVLNKNDCTLTQTQLTSKFVPDGPVGNKH